MGRPTDVPPSTWLPPNATDGQAPAPSDDDDGVFALLRRMGEEERAEPLTPAEEAMLERVKAAVLAKAGEP